MKSRIFAFILFILSAVATLGSDFTNGVFYIDNPIECHIIAMNGFTKTNQLASGKTYMVGDTLLELVASNKTSIFFSGGPVVQTGTNTTITINAFEQEVKNLNAQPRKAVFGTHNLSLTIEKGDVAVIYTNPEANSSFVITSPLTTYEINGGKYFFHVSEKSVVAYVLEGMMQVHGDKKVNKTEKGNLSVSLPFTDTSSGVGDKIITSIKSVNPNETERFASPILETEAVQNNIQFFVIAGHVIGVLVK